MIMQFEDYSLDQLVDCLFGLLNNSEIPAETVARKIKETLRNNKDDLQKKLDRTCQILDLLEKDDTFPGFVTSENYEPINGYEWTPIKTEDKINFKFDNGPNGDNYEHSNYYWDTDRNK